MAAMTTMTTMAAFPAFSAFSTLTVIIAVWKALADIGHVSRPLGSQFADLSSADLARSANFLTVLLAAPRSRLPNSFWPMAHETTAPPSTMRIAVYTSITSTKDSLKALVTQPPRAFVLFADHPIAIYEDPSSVRRCDMRPACKLFADPHRNSRLPRCSRIRGASQAHMTIRARERGNTGSKIPRYDHHAVRRGRTFGLESAGI